MTKIKAWPVNFRRMNLDWFRIGLDANWLRDVLAALGDGIKGAVQRIDEAQKGNDEEFKEVVVDEECEIIERMLGAAFVVCQVQITETWARCQKVLERCKVTAWRPNKQEILRLGELWRSESRVSKVEVVDAAANYFKHREQWKDADWAKLENNQKQAAEVILAVGATPRSTGNLRTIGEALGLIDKKALYPLFGMVEDWGQRVLTRLRDNVKP